jgi:hypothetical protein
MRLTTIRAAALAIAALLASCSSLDPGAKATAVSAIAAKPELSFPRRRPMPTAFMLGFLHEAPVPARSGAAIVAMRRKPYGTAASRAPLPEPEVPRRAAPLALVSPALDAPQARPAALAEAPPPAAAPAAKAPPAQAAKPPLPAAPKEGPKPAAAPKSLPKEAPKEAPKPSLALPLAPPSAALAAVAGPETPAGAARSVAAEAGMRVELPFDGTGWTYLGDKAGREGVVYESRRFEGGGLVFVLLAAKSGDYLLRFQRQDALRGISYDEIVALSVRPRAALQAPPAGQAAAAEPGAAAAPPSAQAAAARDQAAKAAKAPAPDSPEGMLLEAKNELGAGRAQGAIEALDRLLSRYPSGTDEAFYVYALALEQNGPLKDIKRAFALYKKVCADYPQSAFWDASAERASYIERHYFEIR